jgi:1-deoxy-D-xylulose-5-phosphate reductoisomerase
MARRRRVLVLGASGSIGRQCLDIIASRPDLFELAGLQARADGSFLKDARDRLGPCPLCLSGEASPIQGVDYVGEGGILRLIRESGADICVNGIAGSPGLIPSFACAEIGMRLALANKESLVMAGKALLHLAAATGSKIIPVDSEHASARALINGMRGNEGKEIAELILTASGGPFRAWDAARIARASPEEASAHPTWRMGRKISIDSASMANKGLEVIEAAMLFGLPPERIKVAIQAESLVHALIRCADGALFAHISKPDMRLPIYNALIDGMDPAPPHLERYGELDFGAAFSISFEPPDGARFPMLPLAYEALNLGDAACAAYTAADEVAVEAFCDGRIAFGDIAAVVGHAVRSAASTKIESASAALEAAAKARACAIDAIKLIRARK